MSEPEKRSFAGGVHGPNSWPADGSLPEKVERYIEWCIALEKDPPTKKAWADANGVHRLTLNTWDKDDRVKRALDKRASEWNMHPAQIQAVLNGVFKAATQGDMKAAQLYLQHVDKLAPKRLVIEDRSIAQMSDDELKAELAKAGILAEGN